MASINNIDLSGIKRFKRSLNQIRNNNGVYSKNEKLGQISSVAYDILNTSYSSTPFTVKNPEIESDIVKMYVVGEGIAFDEFGTGFYAKGSYKGNLPSMTLQFESVGFTQTTNGWQYYYTWQGDPSKNPKKTYEGVKGWFTKKEGKPYFHTGKKASNRFYNATIEIKEKLKGE